jgi:hypothetical protein
MEPGWLSQYNVWLRTGRPGIDLRQRQRIFFSSLCVQTGSGAHPASYPMGTKGKARPRRDADHSLLSSAEVKNEYELYLLSPLRLHGV